MHRLFARVITLSLFWVATSALAGYPDRPSS